MGLKFKKYFAIVIIVISAVYNTALPVTVYAADPATSSATLAPSPTPTPAPTSVTATNSATLTNTSSTTSNTGSNSIPATGSASLTATLSASLNSTPSANSAPNANPGSSIKTGNAVSVTSVDNSVNTNSINSKFINQTINIYVSQNGNINLSDPFTLATDAILSHPSDPVINLSVVNVNNYAYITNNVNSVATTGGNNINAASGNASITTGNAYSAVSLLNRVNFTIINSVIHVVTINVFGKLNGNIILPGSFVSLGCGSCGINLVATNSATVTNSVNSLANTGGNSIRATGSANLATGNTRSVVNIENIVNTNLINSVVESLYINLLGQWNGNFIGWYQFDPKTGGTSLVFSRIGSNGHGCTANCSANLNVMNSAILTNNVNSLANTGGNSIQAGSGGANVATGIAYSAVSLLNFVNSTFINTYGFFGFVNIFGDWTGNIGGANEFAALSASNQSTNSNSSNSSPGQSQMEKGGLLKVTNTNNTGVFVNPGDTVTFFVNTDNIGTGKVYGTQLQLFLIHNGKNVGGTAFNLGDIQNGQGVKISTGFVLSKNTPPGLYTARAVVVGKVGPNNAYVTAFSDSTFNVSGNLRTLINPLTNITNGLKNTGSVLGEFAPTFIKGSANDQSQTPLFKLLAVILTYLVLRTTRERKKLEEVFQSSSFKEKLVALRMFLL